MAYRRILLLGDGRALYRSRRGGPSPSGPGTRRGDEVRQEHGQDEQGTDDPSLGVPGGVRQREPISQIEDDEDRENHAGHRARASEDADATQEHHRDDVELETFRSAPAHRSEAGGEEYAGERGDRAAHDENGQLHARDAHAGIARDLAARPNDIDVAPEAGELQQHGRDDEQCREDEQREREWADERLLAEPVEPLGETADGAVLHEQERDAAI